MTTELELSPVDEIAHLHSEIIGHARTTLDKAIRIGELLTAEKAKLKHGEWLPWIEEHLPFSHPTAARYMRCFERRDEICHADTFELTDAYRLLAAPAEPDAEPFAESPPEAAPPPLPKTDIRTCGNGHSYDAEKWDAKASGYECPFCWRNDTAPKPEPAPAIDTPSKIVHVSHNSGENEWYTPPKFTDAARSVMGKIDLDPATCELANESVKATKFYTKEDDGLSQVWTGNVWMNPPYAQPLIGQFAEKLASEVEFGNVKQACVLVNNATDTAWFHRLMEHATAICFPLGRIRFIDKEGNPSGAPLQGQAIIYFGPRASAFRKQFKQFGFVL